MPILFRRDDALIAGLFCTFCLLTGLINPEFFSIGTVFDLIRAAIVPGIFAMGVLLVLISGGIDVSFTAIAVLAMYASVKLVLFLGLGAHVIFVFASAMLIGLGLGLFNAFFIGTLRLPTLIVTLGTLSVYRGFLLTFVGASLINTLPAGMRSFAHTNLLRIEAPDGSLYLLPAACLVFAAVVGGAWLLLSRSTLGRSIFALGGSTASAERIGINVTGLQYFVYGLVGMLSGIAGVVHASLSNVASPFELVGLELSVIAAVVLGGARISGGHGSIAGTMLGVALVAVMNNTLIMWHVPSTWQNVVIGALILIGTGAPEFLNRRRALSL
jgi:simple sugar transport system permease protein